MSTTQGELRRQLFHPEALAKARAHDRHEEGTCANDAATNKIERQTMPCSCRPDPDDLDEVWAGRRRMAKARWAAGVPLDDIDREALAR